MEGIPASGAQVKFRKTMRVKPEASDRSGICLVVREAVVAADTWDIQPVVEVKRDEEGYSHDLVLRGEGLEVEVPGYLAPRAAVAEEVKEVSYGQRTRGDTEKLEERLDTSCC